MPYSGDAGGRTWQESVSGIMWTDNPRITVMCDRFATKSKHQYFIVAWVSA